MGHAVAARRKEIPAFDVTSEDRGVDEALVGLGAADEGNDVGHVADELVVGLAKKAMNAGDLVVGGGIEADRQDHAISGPWGEDAKSAGRLVVGIAEDPFVADARLMKKADAFGEKSCECGAGAGPPHADEVRATNALQMSQRCGHSQRFGLALDRRCPPLDVQGEGAVGQMHEEVGGVTGSGRHLDVDGGSASEKSQADGGLALGATLPFGAFVAFDEGEQSLEPASLDGVGAIGDSFDQASAQDTLERGQDGGFVLAPDARPAGRLVDRGSGSPNGTPLRSLHGAEFIRHARTSRLESRPTYRS